SFIAEARLARKAEPSSGAASWSGAVTPSGASAVSPRNAALASSKAASAVSTDAPPKPFSAFARSRSEAGILESPNSASAGRSSAPGKVSSVIRHLAAPPTAGAGWGPTIARKTAIVRRAMREGNARPHGIPSFRRRSIEGDRGPETGQAEHDPHDRA